MTLRLPKARGSPGVTILKVGGSLITHKNREGCFHLARARSLAGALSAHRGPLVLTHGTGSYGKPPARRFGYLDGTLGRARLKVAVRVDAALERLRSNFLGVLRRRGLPAFGVSAVSLFRSRGRNIRLREADVVRGLLQRGLLPVIAGGFVIDETGGLAVCSSDAIAAELARALRARRLIFATDRPGVVSAGGRRPLPQLRREELERLAWPSKGDVSGGMRSKLELGFRAAQAGVETFVIDGRKARQLALALAGHSVPGTRLLVAERRHGR